MAHPSKNVLKHVQNNTNGFTQDLVFPLENGICPGCAKGKMHNKPFPPLEKRASKPFNLIHADLLSQKEVGTVAQKTAPMFAHFGKIGTVRSSDISKKSDIII